MKQIPASVESQLYQRKLKHTRDYEANCREVENDFKWFFKYCIPATILACLIIIAGVFLIVYHADAIDAFFTSIMPNN